MEIIRGKQTSSQDARQFAGQLASYQTIHMDVGTGDGRFVQTYAHRQPSHFSIGIDACRENLEAVSRRAPKNSLFVIANARTLPIELFGLATAITINFPWGSLLEGLVNQDDALMASLVAITQPQTRLDVCLNASALKEINWSLEEGVVRIRQGLVRQGFAMQPAKPLVANDLKAYPTTWAKRLAFGRDPRAMYLSGQKR